MTERGLPIVDGAPACPFVAFEDDRDERASSPDHRHRCYAEPNPAPRALAHQEAYCLSSAFPVCPTFQDWARREAARSRREPAAARGAGDGGPMEPAQRNPPRDWSAPPPWMGGAGAGEEVDDRWERDEDDAPRAPAVDGDDDRFQDDDEGAVQAALPSRGRGLSGSYADRVASGGEVVPGDDLDAVGGEDELAPRAAAAVPTPAPEGTPQPRPAEPAVRPRRERDPDRVAAFSESNARGATVGGGRERGGRRDPRAPEWERARPMEAYPTLRSRRLPEISVPPILVSVIAIALAAAVLFALPGLLGFGSPGTQASPTAVARPSPTALVSLPPTPVPEPTQQVYVVKAGDTMSRIANRFDVPLEELIAANAENIPNPDELQIGDQVIIPVIDSDELDGDS